jgi:hypothetical protein
MVSGPPCETGLEVLLLLSMKYRLESSPTAGPWTMTFLFERARTGTTDNLWGRARATETNRGGRTKVDEICSDKEYISRTKKD